MKAVILAGGFGTRLAEETTARPKPMVEIGGRPILWHIMKIFEAGGVNEFVIALGYKGEVIKDYFLNFYAINNDITVDLATGDATRTGQAEGSVDPSARARVVGEATLRALETLTGEAKFELAAVGTTTMDGVTVALVQMPCRSGCPKGVLGTCHSPSAAVTARGDSSISKALSTARQRAQASKKEQDHAHAEYERNHLRDHHGHE